MKPTQFKLILFIVVLIFSCNDNQSQKEFKRLKVWEGIQLAVKENRIDYLLEISKDTLECIECNDGESWILKEEFYSNYIKQIEQSKNKEYSIYSEEIGDENGFITLHRINYAEEFKGNSFNTIYTILEKENEIQFQGVFSVP